MKFTEKISRFLKQEDYTDAKCIFNALCMDGGSSFDGNWLKNHMPLIKELFLKTPNVDIWCNYGKASHHYAKVCIEDILLENDNLKVRIKEQKKGRIEPYVGFYFEKPSQGYITIRKGIGSQYSVCLYSKENRPSQIIFSYSNI